MNTPSNIQPGDPALAKLFALQITVSLSDAVATQTIEICNRVLSQNTAAINESGWNGLAPLHKACLRGSVEHVEWCLNHGANPNQANNCQETPLHYAAKRGVPLILDILLRAGADPLHSDNLGKNVLHHAAQSGSVTSLLYLESSGRVNMDSVDLAGRSPLHWATQHVQLDALRFLLRNDRVRVDMTDEYGDTALHVAVKIGNAHLAFHMICHPVGYRCLSIKNKADKLPNQLIDEDTDFARRNYITRPLFNLALLCKNNFQFRILLLIIRMHQFLGPIGFYGCGLLAFHYLSSRTPYAPMAIYMGTLAAVGLAYRQGHRTQDASQHQNPVYAGSFMAGFFFTVLAFYQELLPHIRQTYLPHLALFLVPIALITWLYLLFSNPGVVSTVSDSSVFLELTRNRQDILERFCLHCENAYPHRRVKHCKLCEVCVEDMDHHCLFLLRCIGRRTHRIFVLFLILFIFGMMSWIYATFVVFQETCRKENSSVKSGLLDRLICFFWQRPFVMSMLFLNVVSMLWGLCTLKFQLAAIGRGGTCYFQHQLGYQTSKFKMICNIIRFLTTGRIVWAADASFKLNI